MLGGVKSIFPIGIFSKINRITPKTLRHYDKIGLLKPECIDQTTGYRYYSAKQLLDLHRILAFKQMGLTLSEIREVIDKPISLDLLLKLKEQEIKKNIEEEKVKLRKIQNYMRQINKESAICYNVMIKELPEVIVASMRTIIPSHQSHSVISAKVKKYLEEENIKPAEPPYYFTIYHDGEYKEKNIDLEICQAVTDYGKSSSLIKFKKIDTVLMAACVLHEGSYSTLNLAYGFLFQWIEDNGYEVIAMPRESYIDENPQELVTELQVPIG